MIVADLVASLGLRSDGAAFERGAKMLEHLKERVIEAVVAYAGFEGIKGIYELVAGTAELAEQTKHTAQAVGTTTDAVQELGYAARITGTSTEEMQTGLMHLARSVAGAKDGTGPTADAFRALGISMNDPAIKSGDTARVFELLSEKISKMPDGVDKTALSMTLLGRSGARLIPLMDKGAKGIGALSEEAKKSGNVLNDSTIEAFEEFKGSTNKLGAAFTGLKNIAATKLLPVVGRLVETFAKWLEGHHDQIIDVLSSAVQGLSNAVEWAYEHWDDFADVLHTVGDVLGFIIDHIRLIATIVVAPFAVMIAMVYLVIRVVTFLISKLGAAKDKFLEILDWILDRFGSVSDAVLGFGSTVYGFFAGVGSAIKGAVGAVIDWIEEKIKWIEEKVQAITDKVKAVVGVVAKPGTALGDAAFSALHGDDIDHSDENQDQSPEAVAKRQAASAAYYQRGAPDASVNPSAAGGNTTVTNSITLNSSATDPKAAAEEFSAQIKPWWQAQMRDANGAAGGQ